MEEIKKNSSLFAIIKTGGKQYKVKTGDKLKVEKLPKTPSKIKFKDILFGKIVFSKIIAEGRLPKVRILKFHRRKRYKRVSGHKQPYTEIQIEKIG